MPEDDEPSTPDIGLGRTLALSDGIFAIAMTLVAFQIPTPKLPAHYTLTWAALGKNSSAYFGYLITFLVIGVFWMAHHRVFRNIERTDDRLMFLNLIFLMAVAALPFPTDVLEMYGGTTTADVLYAGSMMITGLLLSLLIVVAHRHGLTSVRTPPGHLSISLWRSLTPVVAFGVSIPIAYATPGSAPYLWILILPMRFLDPASRQRRRAAKTPASTP